ncbi:DUF4374 domain-containing protein [Pontibacter qinzhouensis]|uniref:DUF4374 domain-containing protein n=2 Tax=Pontibacter qinzhouensis TaxID=2603253 RepID=A0A5C8KEJ6_9BACT|nr:DUF4374 domain-containing protein [Pontibacter qinzhouensis]
MLFTTSCNEDDPIPAVEETTGTTKYIITSTPTASEGVADYLLTTDDLTTGTISTVGNGIEQDGTYRYYVTNKNRFFSLLYGQGNPGAVTTYELNGQGKLTKLSNFQSEAVQAFAAVNDDILMMKIPRSGDENASWYRVNAEQMQIVGEGKVNIVKLAGNGERAHFTWLTQVGDKVYAPYMSIKGCCSDAFGTQYPDSSWVAVFSYPDMALEKVIKDDRISFVGRYFTNGLVADEKGDAYAFSSSVATSSGNYTSSKPSAVLKINKGQTEFDQIYYFDLEQASGGYHITAQNYAGNGKFILMMSDVKNAYGVGKRFAVADVYAKTFTWVQGAPEATAITDVTTNNLVVEDGIAYIGITTAEGSYVYKFDAGAATATQGIKVDGGKITAISKLSY